MLSFVFGDYKWCGDLSYKSRNYNKPKTGVKIECGMLDELGILCKRNFQ
ncbi:MAG: hypothetical protein ACJA2S_004653 [Cyclobacteriaceae bacterium]|jgi:hypothetical protein